MGTMKAEYGSVPEDPIATEPLAQKSVKKAKAIKEAKVKKAAKVKKDSKNK